MNEMTDYFSEESGILAQNVKKIKPIRSLNN